MTRQKSVILIIEDDDASRMILANILESSYLILSTSTGYEGIKLFKENHVDLVILDIKLPDIHGYEVLKCLRSTHPEIPIIAHSASVFKSHRQEYYAVGFSDFIPKPFSFEKAKKKILNHLKIGVY